MPMPGAYSRVSQPMTNSASVPITPDDTRPHVRRSRLTRRGCLARWLLILYAFLILPLFACGIVTVIYLVLPPAPTDILLLGLDARDGEDVLARTDSILMLGIDPSRLRVSVLSIPRDLFIDVPGYGLQRVNSINLLGETAQQGSGPALLASSLSQDFGVQIDRYLRLDFAAFVTLIDVVGGVTIDVERVIIDDAYPTSDGGTQRIRFESGVQHMDGARALIYARTRHADDDYHRAERQQQILSALAIELRNPVNWPAVLGVLSHGVDTDLTLWDMLMLAPPVALNAGRFDRLVIDREYIIGTADGKSLPNYDRILPWLRERFD